MIAFLTVLVVLLALSQIVVVSALRRLARRVGDGTMMLPPDALGPDGIREPSIEPASTVPELSATTTGGVPLSQVLAEPRDVLVAFVSPNCIGCEEARPALVSRIGERLAEDLPTIVVVAETRERIAAFERDYPGAQVVADGTRRGAVSSVFGVSATPSYTLVDAGVVRGSALDLHELDLVVDKQQAGDR